MKKYSCYLLFLFLIFSLHVFGQGFQKLYSGANHEGFVHPVPTFDGIYVLGNTASSGAGSTDLAILYVDLAGNVVWAKTYGGSFSETPDHMVITADGGLAVVGSSKSFNSSQIEDLVFFKTNNYGNIVWQKIFPAVNKMTPAAMVRTFDNGFAMTGNAVLNGFNHAILIRANSAGDTVFTSVYGSDIANDAAVGLTQTPDSGFLISGKTFTNTNGQADMMLIKTDPMGNMEWAKAYGLPSWEEAEAATIANDSNYLMSGSTTSLGAGDYDILLWKCDTAGNYIWGKTYGGLKTDASYSVHENADGSIIVAGYTNSMGYGHPLAQDTIPYTRGDDSTNIFLMKTTSTGDTIWTETYGSGLQDEAFHFGLMSDGGYVIPGMSNSYTNTDSLHMLLIRTDGQGYSGCHEQRSHPIVGTAVYSPVNLPFTQSKGMVVNNLNLTVMPWNVTTSDACQFIGISSPDGANESGLSVFPNPVSDKLALRFPEVNHKPAVLTVYSLVGEILFSKTINSADEELNLSIMNQGTYLLEVRTDESVLRSKIIKI